MKRASVFVFFALAAFCAAPSSARAWGCEGHQVVALLAEKHLTQKALSMVQQILKDEPIDPALNRYCQDGGLDVMADAATWADDIRTQRPETAPWHYINIPLGATQREIAKFCAPPGICVTQAITDQLAILRQSRVDPEQRAEALRFVIHFVADLHQPLHAATNNDQGGNCVPVAYFGALPQLKNPQTETYAPNLHAIWDTNIFDRETTGKTVEEAASELEQLFGSRISRWERSRSDVNQWVWESHQIAVKTAYGRLPIRIPLESPRPVTTCADDHHIAARMLKLNELVGQPYEDVAAPVVETQIAKAGARLALLLNQIWP